MWMDVTELRDFYDEPLGQVARRFVRRRIRQVWPDVAGYDVLGLGYATPFLRPFKEAARRVVAFMPAAQGVVRWPALEPSVTSLVNEVQLPLPDACMDRVLLVHGIEHGEALRPMMREIWRVLAPEGRLLVVAPNRQGLWARFDTTPFGHGYPFSQGQLSRLLRECMFEPEQVHYALFMPPLRWRVMMTSAGAWEDAGKRFWRSFGGVVMVEVTKRVTAAPKEKRLALLRPVAELAARRWRERAGGGLAPAPAFTECPVPKPDR